MLNLLQQKILKRRRNLQNEKEDQLQTMLKFPDDAAKLYDIVK